MGPSLVDCPEINIPISSGSPLTYSPTHLLTYSPTHLLTYSPTHLLTSPERQDMLDHLAPDGVPILASETHGESTDER